MKLGVITDGISRNPERAFAVMNEFGLEYAELQYIDDLEAGDLNDAQTARLQDLLAAHKLQVPCISRHIFGGLVLGRTGDSTRRCTGSNWTPCAAASSLRRRWTARWCA